MEFSSRRSQVYGRKGMVACSQPLAAQAGVNMLKKGGTAADAAVAVASCLAVTEPCSTGVGGDCFVLYYDAKEKEVTALNGSGRSPSKLTLEYMEKKYSKTDRISPFSADFVTVPGAVRAWEDLQQKFGVLQWKEVLQNAVDLASEGFPVSPLTAKYWCKEAEKLQNSRNGSELLIDGKRGPEEGDVFQNKNFSAVLEEIQIEGSEVFYNGWIAERIVDEVAASGGVLTLEDMKLHQSTFERPLSTSFDNILLHEIGPNSQGIAALLALNMIPQVPDFSTLDPFSADYYHVCIECMRRAFADTKAHVCDPATKEVPVDSLLSEEHAKQQMSNFDMAKATSVGTPFASSDTVYFSVVDAAGNACSVVNSNYMGFGTGIVPRGCGFSLQNRGHNFSFDEKHPNCIGPNKRSYHTIIPALSTYKEDGSLHACFGVMGGFMQPQGHLQVFLHLVRNKFDPQKSLDLPRFCIVDGESDGIVAIEDGVKKELVEELTKKGHRIVQVKGLDRAVFGRGQVIARVRRANGDGDVFVGGTDPRADGIVVPVV